MDNQKIDIIGTLLEAYIDYSAGNDSKGLELLTIGMTSAREIHFTNFGCLPKEVLANLCARALLENVEPGFVRDLILANSLDSVIGRDVASWPVPVKIYSMGRFSLAVNGRPLVGSGNAQRKPIELLKAIVALGGREVCIQRICDCIWPDVEGDASYQNFTVTLFRLRKLIGNDSIRLQDRRVTLDSSQCWVDVWELERLLSKLEGLGQHFNLPYAVIEETMNRVLTLYKGPFLGEGEVLHWAISLRERLRSRFIRTLMVVGHAYEQMDMCAQAIIVFQRAIELDPLAEEFHQRLIACLAEQGRYAEALAAYHRCEQVLALSLRVSPALETRAIYQALLKKQRPELQIVSGH